MDGETLAEAALRLVVSGRNGFPGDAYLVPEMPALGALLGFASDRRDDPLLEEVLRLAEGDRRSVGTARQLLETRQSSPEVEEALLLLDRALLALLR